VSVERSPNDPLLGAGRCSFEKKRPLHAYKCFSSQDETNLEEEPEEFETTLKEEQEDPDAEDFGVDE
jgi:hypothetical protein